MNDEPTNRARADRAAKAIATYQKLSGCDDDDALRDLLTDILHLCDFNLVDFDFELRGARRAHEEEEVCDVRNESPGT